MEQPIETLGNTAYPDRVVIVGMHIPFWDMVVLLIKLALASIPAAFVASFLWALCSYLLSRLMQYLQHAY